MLMWCSNYFSLLDLSLTFDLVQLVVDPLTHSMHAQCLPDYGTGVQGWRSNLLVQANHLAEDWLSVDGTIFYSWLVRVSWLSLQAGKIVGPLPKADPEVNEVGGPEADDAAVQGGAADDDDHYSPH